MSKQHNIQIREMNPNDENESLQVVNLVNTAYRTSSNWTHEANFVKGDRITLNSLQQQSKQWTHLVAVDLQNSSILGVICTGITNSTICGQLDEQMGYFGMIAVHSLYQSKKIGSQLLNAAEQFCKQRSMNKMAMTVLEIRHDIITWYKRKGYQFNGQKIYAQKILDQLGGQQLLQDANFAVMIKSLD